MYKRTNRCLDVNGSSVVKKSVPVLMCVSSEHQDALSHILSMNVNMFTLLLSQFIHPATVLMTEVAASSSHKAKFFSTEQSVDDITQSLSVQHHAGCLCHTQTHIDELNNTHGGAITELTHSR